MCRCGKTLTRLRKTVAGNMQDSVTRILRELGMPGACFTVRVFSPEDSKGISCDGSRIQVFPHGFDKVEFFFTANPGEDSMPVNKVASGGEISRLMLAMKSFMEQCDPVPTLIFDEIDAGVGGKAGQALAERLKTLGRFHQVLCVTHLAVVAAVADNHYVVSKEEIDGRTYASVRKVTGEDRVLEIARMLSGTEYGVSLEHARELLEAAKGRG